MLATVIQMFIYQDELLIFFVESICEVIIRSLIEPGIFELFFLIVEFMLAIVIAHLTGIF